MSMFYYSSPLGVLEIQITEKKLSSLLFVINPNIELIDQVLEQDKPLINQIKEFLNNYFLSKNPQEDFALQDNNGEFYLQVMSEIRQIPYGKTLIYSDLAKKINRPKAARAVGNALGKNSILIINPCHRVVAKTGLGGFTANLWRKKYLLALEQGKLIDIGLNSTQVRLSSNSTHWNELFNIEKEAILSVLDIDPIQIQHIGSTAINNIQAKPIIDIMLGVKPEQVTEIMPLLKLIGWVYKANFEPKEWHFLAKEINGYVTHHLHVCHYNSNFYKEHIAFRDILNREPVILQEYEEIKQTMCASYANSRKEYTSAKSDFIVSVINKFRESK